MNLELEYQRETGTKPNKDYLIIDRLLEDEEEEEKREKELEILYNYINWLEEKLESVKEK